MKKSSKGATKSSNNDNSNNYNSDNDNAVDSKNFNDKFKSEDVEITNLDNDDDGNSEPNPVVGNKKIVEKKDISTGTKSEVKDETKYVVKSPRLEADKSYAERKLMEMETLQIETANNRILSKNRADAASKWVTNSLQNTEKEIRKDVDINIRQGAEKAIKEDNNIANSSDSENKNDGIREMDNRGIERVPYNDGIVKIGINDNESEEYNVLERVMDNFEENKSKNIEINTSSKAGKDNKTDVKTLTTNRKEVAVLGERITERKEAGKNNYYVNKNVYNEVKDNKQRGFWLINQYDKKQPLYDTFEALYEQQKNFTDIPKQTITWLEGLR